MNDFGSKRVNCPLYHIKFNNYPNLIKRKPKIKEKLFISKRFIKLIQRQRINQHCSIFVELKHSPLRHFDQVYTAESSS